MGNDIFSSLASFFEQDTSDTTTPNVAEPPVDSTESQTGSVIKDTASGSGVSKNAVHYASDFKTDATADSSTVEQSEGKGKTKKRKTKSEKGAAPNVSSQINSKSPFAYMMGLMEDTHIDTAAGDPSVAGSSSAYEVDAFVEDVQEEPLRSADAKPIDSVQGSALGNESPALDFTNLGVGMLNDDMFKSLLNMGPTTGSVSAEPTEATEAAEPTEPIETVTSDLLSQLNTGNGTASVFDALKSVNQNTFMPEETPVDAAEETKSVIPPVNPLNPSHINYTISEEISDKPSKQVGRPGLENALSNSSNQYTDEFVQSLRGIEKDGGSSKKNPKVKMAQEYVSSVGVSLSDLVEQSLSTPVCYNDVEALGCFKCGAEKMYSSNKSNASRGSVDSGSQKQSKDSVKILGLIVRCLKPMKVPCISSKYTLQTGWKSTDVTWVDVKAGDVVYLTKAELFVFLCSTPEGVLNLGSGFTMRTESGLVEEGCCVLFSLRFDTYQKNRKTNPNALPTLVFNFSLPSGVKAAINAEDILIDSTVSATVDNLKPEYKEKMTPYILSLASSKNKVDVSQKAKEMQKDRVAAANTCCNLAAMAQALNRMYTSVASFKS